MIWILLALLGVPLWLVAGALIAGLISRRAFCRSPGVFKTKIRLHHGEVPGLDESWPRLPSYARWVHDVLIVHRGMALVRSAAYPVTSCTALPVSAEPPRRLGDAPLSVELTLDGGAIAEMAVPSEASDFLLEPAVATPL
jgi:hypothetical protein